MAEFAPQPKGTGPVFPISLSLVAPVIDHSTLLAPKYSEKLAPVAAIPIVLTGPRPAEFFVMFLQKTTPHNRCPKFRAFASRKLDCDAQLD